MNITESCKFTRCSNAAAAGQTAVNGTAIDMKGFDTCCFVVPFGAITASGVQSIKVQTSSDNNSADAWADLEGTKVTVADDDDNQLAIVEVSHPRERYLRCVVSRATQDSVVDGIIAIQSRSYAEPVTQDTTTVVAAELHHAPAEGTA